MKEWIVLGAIVGISGLAVLASAKRPEQESVEINGVVLNYHTLYPITGATITFGAYTATTDAEGRYSFMIPIGTSGTISCSAAGYVTGSYEWVVTEPWGINFNLMPI